MWDPVQIDFTYFHVAYMQFIALLLLDIQVIKLLHSNMWIFLRKLIMDIMPTLRKTWDACFIVLKIVSNVAFTLTLLFFFSSGTGDALSKLEERGVVIRFVIGRRFFPNSHHCFSINCRCSILFSLFLVPFYMIGLSLVLNF